MQESFTTRSLNVRYPKDDPHRALDIPIYESVAFGYESSEQLAANFRGEIPGHAYSRTSNPTVEFFEKKIKTLTGAWQALAVTSGMAAITNTVMALCRAGDNIIADRRLFGHTYSLFSGSLANYGLQTRFTDTTKPEDVERLIDKNTRLIYFETVTNPQLEIADIAILADVANRHNIPLVADSTLTPPSVFNSSYHGVHIEVMSTTKFISGGGTSFGGVILDNGLYDWSLNPNTHPLHDKLGKDCFIVQLRKNYYRNMGSAMTAHNAHYQIMGLDILELRVNRCYENCMAVARFLQTHDKVGNINYPGLPSSAYYGLAVRQFSGKPGAIMTFDLATQEAGYRFMDKLKIIRRATNINDNKSLIIHPHSTIYGEFSADEKKNMGIRDTMIRLSVGIEAAADIITDLNQALDVL